MHDAARMNISEPQTAASSVPASKRLRCRFSSGVQVDASHRPFPGRTILRWQAGYEPLDLCIECSLQVGQFRTLELTRYFLSAVSDMINLSFELLVRLFRTN